MEQIKTAQLNQWILPAPGLYKVRTNCIFQALIMNFSKKPVVLHKQTCIAICKGPPECLLVPQRDGESELTADVKAVHYKTVEDRQTQTGRIIEVGNKDAERKALHSRNDVEVDVNSYDDQV